MKSSWPNTDGPSIFTKDKSKSAVSTQVQAKLVVKPRGKEAPIKGRGKIKGLNAALPAPKKHRPGN